MKAGSTVAHLSFYLAQHLGCDPIILIGQDLSFSDGLYYPPGMQIERIWHPEMSRFQTIEMKQWERIARARHILKRVRDVHGRELYTDEQLHTYAEQFQSDFLASPQKIVNASEGGMALQGRVNMPLREAAEQFCLRELPDDLLSAGGESEPIERLTRAAAALAARRDEIKTLRGLAIEMRELLDRLVELIDDSTAFNRVVARVDEVRIAIAQLDQTYQLVSAVSQFGELRRYSADRSLGDHEIETRETARRRLKRDREFVREFIDGCEFLLDLLPGAIERVEAAASERRGTT
jgi:hypothetical protein